MLLLLTVLYLQLRVTKNNEGISTRLQQALRAEILCPETAVSFEITHHRWVSYSCACLLESNDHLVPNLAGVVLIFQSRDRSSLKISFFHIHTGTILFWELMHYYQQYGVYVFVYLLYHFLFRKKKKICVYVIF